MLEYLALTAVALYLTARATTALFRDRFPHPVDVATISTAYYGIPLSLAGYFDWSFNGMAFLAPFAADQGLAAMAMRFIVVALLALYLGRYMGKRLAGPPVFSRFDTINRFATERVRFALIASIAVVGLGVYLFGLQQFLAGYATEAASATGDIGNALVYIAPAFMGLAIGYAMVLGRTGPTPAKFLILVCIAISLVLLFVRAKRLEVVTVFIPPLLVLISSRYSISSLSWRIFAGAIGLALLILVSIIRVSDEFTLEQVVFLTFSEGLYAGHSMPGILERLVTDTLEYEYGARYVTAPLGFIPRFLWEAKDDLVYAGNIALEGVAPQGATNLLAEIVLQGGLIAVALSYVIMGFIFERIARFEDVWDESLRAGLVPARFGAYLIAVAIFIPHFRDGIIPAIKLSLQCGAFFILLAGTRVLRKPSIIMKGERGDEPRATAAAAILP